MKMTMLFLVLAAIGCGGGAPQSTTCSSHGGCSTCAGDPNCFWCGASATCKPLSGSCSSGKVLVASACSGSSGGGYCSTSQDCGCGNWCDLSASCASGGPASERWRCADSDCPSGYFCSGCGCLIIDTCSTDSDCSLTEYCGTSTHTCRCASSNDCGYNEICQGGRCRWPNDAC